jgi:hypothetical protein
MYYTGLVVISSATADTTRTTKKHKQQENKSWLHDMINHHGFATGKVQEIYKGHRVIKEPINFEHQ